MWTHICMCTSKVWNWRKVSTARLSLSSSSILWYKTKFTAYFFSAVALFYGCQCNMQRLWHLPNDVKLEVWVKWTQRSDPTRAYNWVQRYFWKSLQPHSYVDHVLAYKWFIPCTQSRLLSMNIWKSQIWYLKNSVVWRNDAVKNLDHGVDEEVKQYDDFFSACRFTINVHEDICEGAILWHLNN